VGASSLQNDPMTWFKVCINEIEEQIDFDLQVATQTELSVWRVVKAVGRSGVNAFVRRQLAAGRKIHTRRDTYKKSLFVRVSSEEILCTTLIIKRGKLK
jgi:hypothetical protein